MTLSMISSIVAFLWPIITQWFPFVLCKILGYIVIPEFREGAEEWLETTQPFLVNPSYYVDDGEMRPAGVYLFRYPEKRLSPWSVGVAFCEWKRVEGSDDDKILPTIHYMGRPIDFESLKSTMKTDNTAPTTPQDILRTLERANNKVWSGYKERSYTMTPFSNVTPHQVAISAAIRSKTNVLIAGVGGCGKSTGIEMGCANQSIRMCRINSLTSAFCDVSEIVGKSSPEKPVCVVSEEFDTMFRELVKNDRQTGGVRPSVETKGDLFTLLYDADKPYANHSFVFTTNLTILQLKREMQRIDNTMFASFFRRFSHIITIGDNYQTTHRDIYRRTDMLYRCRAMCHRAPDTVVDEKIFETQQYAHYE